MIRNEMRLTIKALSKNESFARNAVAAFCLELNPTIDQINDIKTAVSEAVTNCVVHAYEGHKQGEICIEAQIIDQTVHIKIADFGVGIADIERARQPFFTSKPHEERSGMGFTVMESFMDSLEITSTSGNGVTLLMQKRLA